MVEVRPTARTSSASTPLKMDASLHRQGGSGDASSFGNQLGCSHFILVWSTTAVGPSNSFKPLDFGRRGCTA